MRFTAKHTVYSFCLGKGINAPTVFANVAARIQEFAARTGRRSETFVISMVIAAETDVEAWTRWEHIESGADQAAIEWMQGQAAADARPTSDTNVRQLADATSAVNINMSTFIGSYASVARMLDEVAAVPGTGGVLLTFDDFVKDVKDFGTRIQPLMRCRQHMTKEAA
ncbi:hypothetical protein [Belnapia arida]|nr:hypothetical protein [Belnapia arida]